MRITELTIHRYLGIKAFKVDKAGKINIITGPNGAGKSAVLKAIREAFQSSGNDPDLIHSGEDKAEIFVKLDNGLLIERTITPKSNTVKVTDRGAPIQKPQTFLNELLDGSYAFNPIEFFRAKKPERRQMLLKVMPFRLEREAIEESADELVDLIDWSKVDLDCHGIEALEELKKHVYETRREQNRAVERLRKAIEQDARDFPEGFDPDRFKAFDYGKAVDDLQEASAEVSEHRSRVRRKDELTTRRDWIDQRQSEIDERIKNLQDEKAKLAEERDGISGTLVSLRQKVDHFEPRPIEQMRATLDDYQKAQKLIHKMEELERRRESVADEEEKHEDLDRLYRILKDDLPRRMFESLDSPVDGLEIDGDEIRVDGKVIDHLSTSEQIRFAVQVAKALAGRLKVICVDGYEALDSATRENFEQAASGDGYEYFIARVGDGPLQIETKGQEEEAVA